MKGTCTVEDCGKREAAVGLCAMHYRRVRVHGDLNKTRGYRKRDTLCTVDGCDHRRETGDLCWMHYRRIQRHGVSGDPYEERFWRQVNKDAENGCWEWTGYIFPTGYGSYGAKKGVTRFTHRIAYELTVGPIPEGLQLDHLCRNRKCCNPDHLEPVTPRENIRRGNGGDSWGYVNDRTVYTRQPKPDHCTEPDCERPIYKRTICRAHYRKWLADPDVKRPRTMTVEDRFWAKVDKTETCWLWTGHVGKSTGYGAISVTRGHPLGAHRYSYELHRGPIPPGFDVDHLCHTRSCVNPDHLRAVSRSENLASRLNRR